MDIRTLVDLDRFTMDEINSWIDLACAIEKGRHRIDGALDGKILCPIFAQESSRTYMNAVTSFLRMGGNVLPLNYLNTRFGSKWNEPTQDFACLINSCCDHVIFRDSATDAVRDLAAHIRLPFINAGNGVGTGAEHPMQALVDLYTLRCTFPKKRVNILMIGGVHIRTTRTQIKLFLRDGHAISVMSPKPPVANTDIDQLIEQECHRIHASSSEDWSDYDVIYHNGIDEDPNAISPEAYMLSLPVLKKRRFSGVVLHSLPRKNELSDCLDGTPHNMYFTQMENSKWLFQSIYWHQHFGKRV